VSDSEPKFPPNVTRSGIATGRSNERTLADELQDPRGFRTRVRQHLDGRRTLLRTRNGFPEYVTIGTIDDLKCLLSPLREKEATSEEASMFDLRKWHEIESDPENPSLDHAHDLVSSDGLFSISPTGLAEWVCKSGDGRTITFFFAEQFPADEDWVAPEPKRIIERSWADRTWHAAQMARISAITLPVLYFVIERLKSITLLFGHRTKPFVWTFAEDGGDAITAKGVACMEHDGAEFSIAARTDYANGALKSLSLRIFAKRGQIITADPGGWLGALDGPSDGPHSGVELVTLLDTNATNLSRATACGQPWHGWFGSDNMTLIDDSVVSPPNYSPWGGTAEAAFDIAPYQTHYVAIPGLPDVPEDTYPADYHANHMRFLKDAVLFGVDRKYSPQSSFQLGRYRWFHYSPIDGSVHVLRIQQDIEYGDLSGAGHIAGAHVHTPPNATMYLTVYDDGKLTLNGVIGTPRKLDGTFGVVTYIPDNPIVWYEGWSGWRVNDEFTGREFPDYPKGRHIPVSTSPTGDRVLYGSASESNSKNGAGFYNLCEITISDDRTSISGDLLFDLYNQNYDITYSVWWVHTVLESPVYPENPESEYWYAHDVSEGASFFQPESGPRVINQCFGATYTTNGTRVLYLVETEYGLPPDDILPSGYAFPQYILDSIDEDSAVYRDIVASVQNIVSIKDVTENVILYSNTTKTSAGTLTLAALNEVTGSDQSGNCTEPRDVIGWFLSNNLSLIALVFLAPSQVPLIVGDSPIVEKVFVRSPNELLPVGEGQPENLEFSSELLKTVSDVIEGWLWGWADYEGGNPDPLYSLGYGCFDPRTGEVRCSFDPTLGYV
jgi:hypothetical protein